MKKLCYKYCNIISNNVNMISLLFSCNVFCNRFAVCFPFVSLKVVVFHFFCRMHCLFLYIYLFFHTKFYVLCFFKRKTKTKNVYILHFSILISSSSINYCHTRIPPWWYHWWFDGLIGNFAKFCCCELRIYCCLHRPHSYILH